MRKTKTVYSFNNNGTFKGTDIAWESWDLDGTFLLPANSTEVEVIKHDPLTERVIWVVDSNSWSVEKITKENTPKPDYNNESFVLEWNLNHWEIKQKPLPTQENTPKPEYDSEKQCIEWDLNKWEVKEIPSKPEHDPEKYEVVWNSDRWEMIEKLTWERIRFERNYLLSQTDWIFAPDVTLKNKETWLTYRQALRDITSNFKAPAEVVWPEKPQ